MILKNNGIHFPDPNWVKPMWQDFSCNFFFNIHLGYSLYFTVVCLCHITRGIPPPSGGIVGKNRSARIASISFREGVRAGNTIWLKTAFFEE